MRFLTRSLAGIGLFAMTLALLLFAAGTVFRAAEDRAAEGERRRPQQERVFAVNVETIETRTAIPVITAFGDVESGRSLELRAALGGRLVRLAPEFREGGRVAAGQLLFEIDPADAQSAVDIARAERAEAEAELEEAEAALLLAEDDLAVAVTQRDLRDQAVTRQRDLLGRGAGTAAAVEQAELALASAEQTVVGRRQALAAARARINSAAIALSRRQINLDEAARSLAETSLRAPYAGLISEVSAVEGRLVGANEKLGVLIDPDALEIAFRVSNAQYARLLDASGALLPVELVATLALDDIPLTARGTVDRAGAQVGEGQTGRLLFATLDPRGAAALRPGDFLTITIEEPPLAAVAVIPSTAATNDGRILLVGDGERLEEASVEILRRQGDTLIVRGAPAGALLVSERLPQLGAGVRVRPVTPGAEMAAPEMLSLDPERRARLVAAVEANRRMPDEARARVLARLAEETVPQSLVERLEARMGGQGGQAEGRPAEGRLAEASPAEGSPAEASPGGETVALDPARRARLIAFVEANAGMPADAKTRILATLEGEAVPRAMVERLEARMGG